MFKKLRVVRITRKVSLPFYASSSSIAFVEYKNNYGKRGDSGEIQATKCFTLSPLMLILMNVKNFLK